MGVRLRLSPKRLRLRALFFVLRTCLLRRCSPRCEARTRRSWRRRRRGIARAASSRRGGDTQCTLQEGRDSVARRCSIFVACRRSRFITSTMDLVCCEVPWAGCALRVCPCITFEKVFHVLGLSTLTNSLSTRDKRAPGDITPPTLIDCCMLDCCRNAALQQELFRHQQVGRVRR